jgi:hypothetical protein
MGGHPKGTVLPVPPQGSIFPAAIRDLRGIVTGPPDVGIIDTQGMEGEQREYPGQDIFPAETPEKVDLHKIRCKEGFQCPTVLAKQGIRPCMFRRQEYLQELTGIVEVQGIFCHNN